MTPGHINEMSFIMEITLEDMLNKCREVLSSWVAFLNWKQSEVTPHKPV